MARAGCWRYIRYSGGSEELYDRAAGPNEWKNFASDPRHAALKASLAKYFPTRGAASVAESGAYDFDFAGNT